MKTYEIQAKVTFEVSIIVDAENQTEAAIIASKNFHENLQITGKPYSVDVTSVIDVLTGQKINEIPSNHPH